MALSPTDFEFLKKLYGDMQPDDAVEPTEIRATNPGTPPRRETVRFLCSVNTSSSQDPKVFGYSPAFAVPGRLLSSTVSARSFKPRAIWCCMPMPLTI